MTIDKTIEDEEQLMQLAREKRGFYKGKKGFYIGTLDKGLDTLMSIVPLGPCRRDLLNGACFWIDELGFPGMELVDLASIQTPDIIAGPFEDRQTAQKILPYVIRARYLEEK